VRGYRRRSSGQSLAVNCPYEVIFTAVAGLAHAQRTAEADRSRGRGEEGFASRPVSLDILDSWVLHIIAPELSVHIRARAEGCGRFRPC
jgi:hypothetical protein